jgi:DUF1009 family protein
MSSSEPRVVGILAGGGSLPREIAERVVAHGDGVHIVALAGEAGDDDLPFSSTRVGWAQIGGMLGALRRAGCKELVIVGAVTRPDLGALRPDLGFFRHLPAILRIIAAGGDDSVLTRVVRFFESQGFKVVGPGAVAPELLVSEGPLGRIAAPPEVATDVALGFDAVRILGPFDVGQAVVVAEGQLEAIEGAEGTDGMLTRLAAQRRARGGSCASPSGVLVKRPKPGQELRIDLPAIGPGTVERAVDAGLAGIAVLAGGVLAAERASLAARADAGGLFVQGFRDPNAAAARRTHCDWQVETASRLSPNTLQHADTTKGADLLLALAPLGRSSCVVVARGHVLAVESGESAAAALERAGGLRQWGRRHAARASGVAVLNDPAGVAAGVVGAAAAGLAGLALVGHPAAALGHAAQEADRRGLFLAALNPAAGTA